MSLHYKEGKKSPNETDMNVVHGYPYTHVYMYFNKHTWMKWQHIAKLKPLTSKAYLTFQDELKKKIERKREREKWGRECCSFC